MASLTKKCRHADKATCPCAWLIRRWDGAAHKDRYTSTGTADHARAERIKARADRRRPMTVNGALDEWMAAKEANPDTRAGSLTTYRHRAAHVRAWFADTPVRDVTRDEIRAFAQSLVRKTDKRAALAPATARGIYHVLTASLRWMADQHPEALPVSPTAGLSVGLPEARERDFDLTLGQIEAMIDRLPDAYRDPARLMYLTGLRVGEVRGLRPEDVEGAYLKVRRTRTPHGVNGPKTGSSRRTITLSPEAQVILARMSLPLRFSLSKGRLALHKALGELYVKGMGWHLLRNAHATLLDTAGVGLRDQAARLGHGHRFVQTNAYRVRSEAVMVDLEAVRDRIRHAAGLGAETGPSRGEVVSLADRRRRPRG